MFDTLMFLRDLLLSAIGNFFGSVGELFKNIFCFLIMLPGMLVGFIGAYDVIYFDKYYFRLFYPLLLLFLFLQARRYSKSVLIIGFIITRIIRFTPLNTLLIMIIPALIIWIIEKIFKFEFDIIGILRIPSLILLMLFFIIELFVFKNTIALLIMIILAIIFISKHFTENKAE